MKHPFLVYTIAVLCTWAFLVPLKALPPWVTLGAGSAVVDADVLPLDEVGAAHAAFSVSRRLREAYAGQCIRIRRDSDNTETDIGFSGNNVDSAAIAAHCSGTTGYVVTIYDQSGNARNLTQATTTQQPIIYQSGAVVTGSNGRVSCIFDSTNDRLVSSFGFSSGTNTSYFGVFKPISLSDNDLIFNLGSSVRVALRYEATGTKWIVESGANFDTGVTVSLNTWVFVGVGGSTAGNESFSLNGATPVTGGGGTNGAQSPIAIGSSTAVGSMEFSEWIVYDSAFDGTANTTLFNNADAYYAIP